MNSLYTYALLLFAAMVWGSGFVMTKDALD